MEGPYLYFSFYLKKIALSIRSDLLNFWKLQRHLHYIHFPRLLILFIPFVIASFLSQNGFVPPSIDTRTAPNQIIGGCSCFSITF